MCLVLIKIRHSWMYFIGNHTLLLFSSPLLFKLQLVLNSKRSQQLFTIFYRQNFRIITFNIRRNIFLFTNGIKLFILNVNNTVDCTYFKLAFVELFSKNILYFIFQLYETYIALINAFV
jgi:hypothetical protein